MTDRYLYNITLTTFFGPILRRSGCRLSDVSHTSGKELIPVIVVHIIIPNKTQWLFSNLAYFRAKNRLQSSANGEIFLFSTHAYT